MIPLASSRTFLGNSQKNTDGGRPSACSIGMHEDGTAKLLHQIHSSFEALHVLMSSKAQTSVDTCVDTDPVARNGEDDVSVMVALISNRMNENSIFESISFS